MDNHKDINDIIKSCNFDKPLPIEEKIWEEMVEYACVTWWNYPDNNKDKNPIEKLPQIVLWKDLSEDNKNLMREKMDRELRSIEIIHPVDFRVVIKAAEVMREHEIKLIQNCEKSNKKISWINWLFSWKW